jgi:transketolase C-terminal domain/subunit
LERKYDAKLDNLYTDFSVSHHFVKRGLSVIFPGLADPPHNNTKRICMISSGFMLGRTLKAANELREENHQITVVDLWRVKPINTDLLCRILSGYDLIITVEEQTLSGGFGSAICEVMCDNGIKSDVLRIGLPERYIFENANRDYLIDNNGLSVNSICDKIRKVL